MLTRLWEYCCSLKIAIYLASAATLLMMGGSLLIPGNVSIFGSMDQMTASEWGSLVAQQHLGKTWWLYITAILIALFALNTFCCFIDWLVNLRSRWRKTGEYLLHLGIFLVLLAYLWGSIDGWRNNGVPFTIGKITPLPNAPDYSLRVDNFKPIMSANGPPQDMISEVTLFHNSQQILQGTTKINQPVFHNGIVITPVSFGQQPIGFSAQLLGNSSVKLIAGNSVRLSAKKTLEVVRFLPDTFRNQKGELSYRNDRIGNPAFQLRIRSGNRLDWQGWYFPRQGLPSYLQQQGILIKLQSPVYDRYSSLTVNYDPGAGLAMAGSVLMTMGVCLALFSFYRKRNQQDRPEI